jgi:tRNA(Arg) A34 adenosine deaminase TadA
MSGTDVCVDLPSWAVGREHVGEPFADDEARMRFAIALARGNVDHGTGGPFGAALFERETGRLVAVGVNSVVRLANSALHAEMVAFMRAQTRLRSYTLAAPGLPAVELHSSCDPCAMCLGAVLWSGVSRLVCAATRDDATALTFDEGPVFPESYDYLERRGVRVDRGFLRQEAVAVLEAYRRQGGVIYNR